MTRPHTPSTPKNDNRTDAGHADNHALDRTYDELLKLHDEIVDFEKSMQAELDQINPDCRQSARNLLDYVELRRHDIRELQGRLSALGLSSLGRSEAYILAALRQILTVLGTARNQPTQLCGEAPVTFDQGRQLLERRTDALFGPRPPGRHVRIMVTMSHEAAERYEHVRELLASGMDCVRINCAHDDQQAWQRMIAHLRKACQELAKPCCLLMDLAGPKLRTGPIAAGPAIFKWRPTRDAMGRVTRPVRIVLSGGDEPLASETKSDFQMMVPRTWLRGMRPNDQVVFKDARGSKRRLNVVTVCDDHVIAECGKTAYLVPGLKLRLRRRGKAGKKWRTLDRARLRHVPASEQSILVKPGERLFLTARLDPGQPAVRDDAGAVLEPALIGCTLPEIFPDLKVGQRIWFDDGKIGGRIHQAAPESIEVEITHARPQGSKLGADKGINLPDTTFHLPALTAKDLDDLHFIVRHADLVGYSFVRKPQDIAELQQKLHALNGAHLGIVLKIETRHAFEQLPHLLLRAMCSPRTGVMIARGDLAVECGYERLAELQEEILWFCEAAHLPVIWATQVLEQLTKGGTPSRAEITDAAMGERAECVMLNKGLHVVEAVKALDDILTRMEAHQRKKRAMLRPLHLAGRFGE